MLIGESEGGRGTVILESELADGGVARIVLGRNFVLDTELAESVRSLPGVISAPLSASENGRANSPPPLALVS
jgi:DNA polymerase-3 subunit alpha